MPRPQKSPKGRSGGLIDLNDDAAEKRRRRNSFRNAVDSNRNSLTGGGVRDSFLRPSTSESTVPLMANFEEWMKLVKDNKINPSNSWNFALIDYFHDMAVLKEGDGINFQKASYTLDGCVKIYTSRVDSVASETGKLLSGLADSGKEFRARLEETGDGRDEEMEETDTVLSRRRKIRSDATLVKDFSQIQVKSLDLELSVDPLFRKMCADFNEGGTKGLLLNSLAIDKTGRVIFDGQVDQQQENSADPEQEKYQTRDIEAINLDSIRETFFLDVTNVDALSICPSLGILQNSLEKLSSTSKFIKDIENIRIEEDDGAFAGDLVDYDNCDDGVDIGVDAHQDSGLEFGVPNFGDNSSSFEQEAETGLRLPASGLPLVTNKASYETNIMAYFDETLRKNWIGPEHWKVQRIKVSVTSSDNAPPKKRPEKVKEPFFIDFLHGEEIDEDVLFADGGSSINISKNQQTTNNRNMLPNDEHFSSQSLIESFLKPQSYAFRNGPQLSTTVQPDVSPEPNVDEMFFAETYHNAEAQGDKQGDYDADFFGNGNDGGDLGFDDEDDDYEVPYSQEPDSINPLLQGAEKAIPDYIHYAKTAKKVNVKLLKDNIWNKLGMPASVTDLAESQTRTDAEDLQISEESQISTKSRKFTDVIHELKTVYAPQQMTEISTSFCFICLLHLANEKGLVIEDNGDNTELIIRKDTTVTLAELSA